MLKFIGASPSQMKERSYYFIKEIPEEGFRVREIKRSYGLFVNRGDPIRDSLLVLARSG